MIKKWLSAYSFRYPRSIVYMLQASEYKVGAYVRWYWAAKNFRHVEVRKQLVKTRKARVLLLVAWMIYMGTFGVATLNLTAGEYIVSFLVIIFAPLILSIGILIPLFILKVFIERPHKHKLIQKTREILAKHPAVKIGIAGSFGKTTMREILRTVLTEGKKAAAPGENYNTIFGINTFVKSLTGDEEILIFELGEYYQGDVKELCEMVEPSIGVITGVNEAHLEKFKDLNKTADTIFELADWLEERSEKPLYINGESAYAKARASSNHILYSREGVAGWKVLEAQTDLSGVSFTLLSKDGDQIKFKSGLLGLHQIGPLAAAIEIALRFNIPIELIQDGIAKTQPFKHRLEPKTDPNGAILIDDSYNGNPDGARVAIEFLASLTGCRRIYVTPGLVEMGAHTEAVHRKIGVDLAGARIEKVFLVKNSVSGYIEAGLKDAKYPGEIKIFETGLAMLSALPHLTAKGDVVLLQNDWPDQYY